MSSIDIVLASAQPRSDPRRRAHFDGTGLCLYLKRLERGRFAALGRDEAAGPMTLTVSNLDLFLDGSAPVGRMALTPPAHTHFSLASDRP